MAVTDPCRVRRLESADAAAVLEVARGLGPWFNAEGLARIAQDLGSHRGHVAVQGGRIVGFILWTRLDARVADLSWMGVAAVRQHTGVGTALLEALVAELRAAGFEFLEVSTVADNVDYAPYAATRRFYRARGFENLRVDPRYWGSGDDRYDRLVLRRRISAVAGRARTKADAAPQNGADSAGQSQAAFKTA